MHCLNILHTFVITMVDHTEIPEAPAQPDIGELIQTTRETRSLAVTVLVVLAIFYTLYFIRTFVAPLALALLLNFLLSPVVRALKRVRIPESVGAGLVIVFLLAGVGYGLYGLSAPAAEWVTRVPASVRSLERRIRDWKKPMDSVTKTAEKVKEIAKLNETKTPEVNVTAGPPLMSRVFSGAWETVVGALILIVLLYFLLASGDLFLRKMIKVLPSFRDKKLAVEIARRLEDHISTYLLTITLIYAALGTAVGTAMWIIGLPSPLLWGVMAAVFNYIPYIGAAAGISVIAIVSFLTFPSPTHALIAPATYLVISIIEGQFISPIILGKRLTLNPVVVFVSLIFWGWLWGVLGAFLAIPLVSSFKIFCDQIEALASIGEFLGE